MLEMVDATDLPAGHFEPRDAPYLTEMELAAAMLRQDLPKVAHLSIKAISAHPHNWHIHPEEQLTQIRASFDRFGPDMDASDYNVRTGHLLDGHARMKILQERGSETIFCQLHDMSEEAENAWLLTKDRLASLAETDNAELKLLLSEYVEEGIFPPGWDRDDYDEIARLCEEDEEKQGSGLPSVPEAPETVETRVKPGEIWRVGRHYFGCLDSESAPSVCAMLAEAGIGRVDQIFTDPPYAMETSGGKQEGPAAYNRTQLEKISAAGLDECDPEREFLPTLPVWFGWKGAKPATKESMSVFVYCNNEMQLPYMRWASMVGARWDTLIWDKGRGDPLGGRHDRNTEYLIWLKYRARWNNAAEAPNVNRSRILRYEIDEKQAQSGHPTPKSPELAMNELQLTTQAGDWVADPYGGTGAHAIAAHMLGRNAIYMDAAPEWCDFAMAWMALVTGEEPERVQGGDDDPAKPDTAA